MGRLQMLGRMLMVSLPGQRVSACTCSGEDHPGPVNTKGRGAPEIDAIEVSPSLCTLVLSSSRDRALQILF
jgi:hypothetical protein